MAAKSPSACSPPRFDASLIDREDGILIARHAVVADHALTWPAGLAPAAKATALAQLKAAGVLVRHAV